MLCGSEVQCSFRLSLADLSITVRVFSQLDTPLIPGVFVFTMNWGHAHADLSLFV